jgi:hypothetical protein
VDSSAFPYLDDSTLLNGRAERLLAAGFPADAPAGVPELCSMLSALREPGDPHELAGEPGAVAVFVAAVKEKALLKEKAALKEKGSTERRLPSHLGPKVAVATAAALIAFTGVAAAAVTGTLPRPLQSFAHSHFGAPSSTGTGTGNAVVAAASRPTHGNAARPSASPIPRSSGAPTPGVVSGAGPVVGGPATAGLCHAYASSKNAPGGQSPPSRNLQAAAAAAGQTVAAFCLGYLPLQSHPSQPAHPSAKPSAPAMPDPTAGTGAGSAGGSAGGSGSHRHG